MAATTIKEKVTSSWGPITQDISPGWFDIMLISGERFSEVYFEYSYFHFTDRKPSIHISRVEWIRLHTKQ